MKKTVEIKIKKQKCKNMVEFFIEVIKVPTKGIIVFEAVVTIIDPVDEFFD